MQPPGVRDRTPGVLFCAVRRSDRISRSMSLPSQPPSSEISGPVLFFDGECGLCNRIVRFLLRIDSSGRLRFAPLQSVAAQAYLRRHGLPLVDFDTLIFVPDWSRREEPDFQLRTAGVISALRATDRTGAHLLASVLSVFPSPLRDMGYRMTARWRYRIFGPWKVRPFARSEWSRRFLN